MRLKALGTLLVILALFALPLRQAQAQNPITDLAATGVNTFGSGAIQLINTAIDTLANAGGLLATVISVGLSLLNSFITFIISLIISSIAAIISSVITICAPIISIGSSVVAIIVSAISAVCAAWIPAGCFDVLDTVLALGAAWLIPALEQCILTIVAKNMLTRWVYFIPFYILGELLLFVVLILFIIGLIPIVSIPTSIITLILTQIIIQPLMYIAIFVPVDWDNGIMFAFALPVWGTSALVATIIWWILFIAFVAYVICCIIPLLNVVASLVAIICAIIGLIATAIFVPFATIVVFLYNFFGAIMFDLIIWLESFIVGLIPYCSNIWKGNFLP